MEDLREINKVKKHKRVALPYVLVSSGGVTLTTRGRDTNEVSSVRHLLARRESANSDIKHKKPNKANSKVWIPYMQWLSQKKVTISKDFKRECEYEWQHDD